jgi:hypothetical protein
MKNDSKLPTILFLILGLINSIGLLLYSYTQVDLNLTLSKISIWQTIQKAFQSIGYFHRPASLWIFLGLLALLFLWYGITIFWISKEKLHTKHVWFMIFCMTGILIFAYPAFSYDLFNHMFTAKTVLLYHKNPYEVTPLAFTGFESWLTFMRWTHIVSIYSPLWIAATFVPYLFGFGYFLWILWNFKLFIALFYLLTAYAIKKILEDEKKPLSLLGVGLFAFNPLVIIESLVSAHNDIVMMGCAVFSLYFLREKRAVWSFLAESLSIAMKLISLVLLPIYLFPKQKWLPIALMSIGTIGFLVVTKREVMPWYLLWTMPFIALYPQKKWLIILTSGISVGLLLRYAPYLYYGHWNDPVPTIKFWVTIVPIITSAIIVLFGKFIYHREM